MRRLRFIVWFAASAVVALTLGGCGPMPPLYAAYGTQGPYGYREKAEPPHRYEVSYTAPLDVSLASHRKREIDARTELAYDLALRRAAELALETKAHWFTIVKRDNTVSVREDPFESWPYSPYGYHRYRPLGALPAHESELDVTVTLLIEMRANAGDDTLDAEQTLAAIDQRRPGITCPDGQCQGVQN